MGARKTRIVRRNGRVTTLLIGEPLPERLKVPKRYQAGVTRLFDHPEAKQLEIGRYLRYHLVTNPGNRDQGWRLGVGNCEDILDGTYPWESDGFSFNEEGNQEGPDCLIIDDDWNLLDPRGRPTLDSKANIENWSANDAFDEVIPKLRDSGMEIRISVLADGRRKLLRKLETVELGWNLTRSEGRKHARHIELTHEIYSGRAILTEPEPGLLLCRIVPTDSHDPERMLALVMGALHRWLQDDAHSMTVDYLRKPKKAPTQARSLGEAC